MNFWATNDAPVYKLENQQKNDWMNEHMFKWMDLVSNYSPAARDALLITGYPNPGGFDIPCARYV